MSSVGTFNLKSLKELEQTLKTNNITVEGWIFEDLLDFKWLA